MSASTGRRPDEPSFAAMRGLLVLWSRSNQHVDAPTVGSPGRVPPAASNVPDDALTNRNLTSAILNAARSDKHRLALQIIQL